MDLPRTYNEQLQRACPDHRVRWSGMNETWQLERRIRHPRTVDPSKYPAGAFDSFIRFRDGYNLVYEFHPQALPQIDKLIAGIRHDDIERIMEEYGFKHSGQVADHYDARDRARAAEQWRKTKQTNADFAAEELFDPLKWMRGERASVPRRWEELAAEPTAADHKLAARIVAATGGAA